MSRRDWVVTLTELGESEHAALQALLGGADLGAAARAAGAGDGELWSFVCAWADRGFLHAVCEREPVLLSTSEVSR